MNPDDPFNDDDTFDWLDWLMLATAGASMLCLAYHIFGKAFLNLIYSTL